MNVNIYKQFKVFSFGVSYAKDVAIIADEYVTQDVIATIYRSLLRYIDHCFQAHVSTCTGFYLHDTL